MFEPLPELVELANTVKPCQHYCDECKLYFVNKHNGLGFCDGSGERADEDDKACADFKKND